MYAFLGCTGPLALVGFVLGFVGTFFGPEMPLGQRFAAAGATAAMVFVAATILCLSDMQKQRAAFRRVRKLLAGRQPMSDEKFAESLEGVDHQLAIDVRHAIAAFLNVPAESIYPTDSPTADLGGRHLEPWFHYSVVAEVIEKRKLKAMDDFFNSGCYVTMEQFIAEVERIVSEAEQSGATGRRELG